MTETFPESGAKPDESAMDILVVDDTAANLKLLTSLLAAQGYRVRPASSGELALRSVAVKKPSLILLDVRMPGMDGYAVCRRLKADPDLRPVPVIFISAMNETTDKVQGFAVGGVDFITKPIEPEEVLARVRTHQELSRLQHSLEQRVAERTMELANAHHALQASEERLRLAFEATSDGIWDWNLKTGTLFFSDRWYSMLGYAPGAFMPGYAAWCERVHPDDLAAAEAAIRGHLEQERLNYAVEFRMRTQAGDWKWISSRGKVIERDAAGKPLRMVGSHVDITESKQDEARIASALHDKEVLLKEIYHRVKNNLQVIASLLSMQARGADDERVRSALTDSVSRVHAMALVHEQLYRSNDLERIAVKTYLGDLLGHLREASPASSRGVELSLDADDATVDIETAIPCGLLVNELVTNALKHAFPEDARGTITTRFRADADGWLTLEVGDDGVGVPAGFDFRQSASLGLRLVASLVDQLQGEMTLERGGGTRYRLHFKENGEEARA